LEHDSDFNRSDNFSSARDFVPALAEKQAVSQRRTGV
jgi:hypothetical protein